MSKAGRATDEDRRPGGVGESHLGTIPVADLRKFLLTEELMKHSPISVEAVSYHFYGNVSQRCAKVGPKTATKSEALTAGWIDATLKDWQYYADLRDKHEPSDDRWVTEAAESACGGSPWASTYLDTSRYVNQLGLLAQKGVKVLMHDTLAASDYSLIQEGTHEPRPNYWVAVLWGRVMGTSVLPAPTSPAPDLRPYAHCLRDRPGAEGLVAINLGGEARSVPMGGRTRTWVMQAPQVDASAITVNGKSARLKDDGSLSGLDPAAAEGSVTIPA